MSHIWGHSWVTFRFWRNVTFESHCAAKGGTLFSISVTFWQPFLGWPRSTVEKGPQSNESYERENLWNRTISTVLWVHKKLPQSTFKLVLPSNESYESKQAVTVPWQPYFGFHWILSLFWRSWSLFCLSPFASPLLRFAAGWVTFGVTFVFQDFQGLWGGQHLHDARISRGSKISKVSRIFRECSDSPSSCLVFWGYSLEFLTSLRILCVKSQCLNCETKTLPIY